MLLKRHVNHNRLLTTTAEIVMMKSQESMATFRVLVLVVSLLTHSQGTALITDARVNPARKVALTKS